MPKMKNHKGIKKRIKVSAKGKVRYKAAGTSHRMWTKSGSRLRSLRKGRIMQGASADTMADLISH